MASIRKTTFVSGSVYHIVNRGVEKRPIFQTVRDYRRFIDGLAYYRFLNQVVPFSKWERSKKNPPEGKTHVDILSYCLMPNHFHLLLYQNGNQGVSKFVNNISNSYAKYFNTKNKRIGSLFQGPFYAVRIESDEELLHVSRYIHLNPVVSSLIEEENFHTYPWSSLPTYLKKTRHSFIETDRIASFFPSQEKFQAFLTDHISHAKELHAIKHLLLDEK